MFIHILVMDGCTAINFVKHVNIVFVQVGVVCAAWHWPLRTAHTKNLDEDNFDMLYQKNKDC